MDLYRTRKERLVAALKLKGENWSKVESCTFTPAELDELHDSVYGVDETEPFTLWTTDRVYFNVGYDGRAWISSVPRNPNSEVTKTQGGY